MKEKGTSIYVFPSAAYDLSYYFDNINFTKVVALNIPEQVSTGSNVKMQLNFKHENDQYNSVPFQYFGNDIPPSNLADQLVESLRNYVANYDEDQRNIRINLKDDFYNPYELQTSTEKIFFKWARKLNLIDFEPATHKIDWDKNTPDFVNNNGTSSDFFQEYLWKEREVINYQIPSPSSIVLISLGTDYLVTINNSCKFKEGDYVFFSGITLLTSVSYLISNVIVTDTQTTFHFNPNNSDFVVSSSASCFLDYNRLIRYVGEIQYTNKSKTSKKSYIEVSANFPHHVGQTPTVLFRTIDNSNYYPDLEIPILPDEISEYIVGAENLNSPIRQNPSNYPGSYYGYFDTFDKTYKCSSGDKLRKSGDYYGVLLSNNIGLNSDTYNEKLTDFNSKDIDGISLDFNLRHYLKTNIPGSQLTNFDEYNSYYFNSLPPNDFEFNALLWYYEVYDEIGNVSTNLYGIEFLNNPNDLNNTDFNGKYITSLKKLVSNSNQDGLSYIFNVMINFDTDNDQLPLQYDPSAVYNVFGFDMYNKLMNLNVQLSEDFVNIISGYTHLQEDILELRGLIYTQTDIDTINNRLENLDNLLNLYSTMQHVDSNSVKIETDLTGVYPTIKFNIVNVDYNNILNLNTNDIYQYNISNNTQYLVSILSYKKNMININNNSNLNSSITCEIVLDSDLQLGQSIDLYFNPQLSFNINYLNFYILYDSVSNNKQLIFNVDLPVDLQNGSSITNPSYLNSYYTNDNIKQYSNFITTGITTNIYCNYNSSLLFSTGDIVYIDNLFLMSGTSVVDFSGAYKITTNIFDSNGSGYTINLNTSGSVLFAKNMTICYYKGMKINILKVQEKTDNINYIDQYKIVKTLY
jgi:hypothetical protein